MSKETWKDDKSTWKILGGNLADVNAKEVLLGLNEFDFNFNERRDVSFKNPNGNPIEYRSVTILEALCALREIVYIAMEQGVCKSQMMREKNIDITNAIKAVYGKMRHNPDTQWKNIDGNGNTTLEWLVWGDAVDEVKDLVKHKELTAVEQSKLRNAFDIVFESRQWLNNKKELGSVLFSSGLSFCDFPEYNNVGPYKVQHFAVLQNRDYINLLIDIIKGAGQSASSEEFSAAADNVMKRLGFFLNVSIHNTGTNNNASVLAKLEFNSFEVIKAIWDTGKLDVKALLEKAYKGTANYESSFFIGY
jgi:hypothetical protein